MHSTPQGPLKAQPRKIRCVGVFHWLSPGRFAAWVCSIGSAPEYSLCGCVPLAQPRNVHI
eukprot:9388377-Pyramimonas_sp.AAC.1